MKRARKLKKSCLTFCSKQIITDIYSDRLIRLKQVLLDINSLRGEGMYGNSGNSHSNVRNHAPKQYGPTVKETNLSLFNLNLFSHNTNALNRTFTYKKNSSKVLFAVVIILALALFAKPSKQEIKIKRK